MLPPLLPLDRAASLEAINQALDRQEEDHALRALGGNPLAVFSWIMVDGVQAYYLQPAETLLHRYGAIAVLFRRWVEQRFRPEGQAEQLAHQCLRAQVQYLRHVFGRLPQLSERDHEAAREAHRRMTAAAVARDQQTWRRASEEFELAFESWREASDPYFQSQVAADWAAVLEQEGEYEEALDKLEFAVQVASQLGDLERLGRRRLHKGKLSLLIGQTGVALHEYREAAGVYRVTREMDQFVLALVAEGEVQHLSGNPEEARTTLEAALLTAGQLDDPELLAFVEEVAASLHPPRAGDHPGRGGVDASSC